MKKLVSLALLTALVAGCSNPSSNGPGGYGMDGFEESLSTGESLNDTYLLSAAPKYHVGSPYMVENIQYTPMADMQYDQTGIAGIVPSELNGSKTSNGETFDVNQMVATSKTLPLPTIVRVTNLDNGANAVVRVNNRGPFVNTRLMDLSPAAAQKLGISGQAKVRIQVMPEQSEIVKNATLANSGMSVAPTPVEQPVATPTYSGSGEYSVQLAAFYAEDSATSMANRMGSYGQTTVVTEGDMYKVRIINLDASSARRTIDALRSNEGIAPGLLKNGRWVNADSI